MESIALRECRLPDFADIQVVALPDGATTDPTAWVKLIFTTANTPIWVKALFAARRALAPILGIPNRALTMFEVDRATTVVKLHGWRGRLYWIPAGFFHASVFKAMLKNGVANYRP